MSRALILYAHPCAESFGAALHERVVGALGRGGWEVDDCDLNAEIFQPVLTAPERRGYHDVPENVAPVGDYVARLRAAEALVLVFPVWNFGYPAILKGFFDRVFLPGVSFELADGETRPALTHVRRLAAVTTYGGTRITATLMGDPPRRGVTRLLARTTRAERTRYLALYDMNRAERPRRERFAARVERTMAAL